jgi:dolichol-phosphate mannosyltransferase
MKRNHTKSPIDNKKVLVILPTYNEQENITNLILDLSNQLNNEGHIIVIDDNSPDGTAKTVRGLINKINNLHLICREGKQGLGSAYREAIRWALKNLEIEIYVHMDADYSHPPNILQEIIMPINEGYDVVIASRYIPGGGVINWSFSRKILSRVGNIFSKFVVGTKVNDSTSGFRALSKESAKEIYVKPNKEKGFGYLVESLVRMRKLGFKIKEVPLIYSERRFGETKLSNNETFQYGKILFRLAFRRIIDR